MRYLKIPPTETNTHGDSSTNHAHNAQSNQAHPTYGEIVYAL